jgi:hypothetical protein
MSSFLMVNNKNIIYRATKKIPFCISGLLMKNWLKMKKNVIAKRQFFALLLIEFVRKNRLEYGKY